MSVSEITPVNRPEILLPGSADAETAGNEGTRDGEAGVEELCGASTVCEVEGVKGVVGEGEAASTTHSRCDLVATSLATVCASVE